MRFGWRYLYIITALFCLGLHTRLPAPEQPLAGSGHPCGTPIASFSLAANFHIGDPSRMEFSFTTLMQGWQIVTYLVDHFLEKHLEQFEFEFPNEKKLKFYVKLAFEEVATNAAKRGNRLDPTKKVHVRAIATDRDLVIEVVDEGEGRPDIVSHAARPDQAGALDHQQGDRPADSNGFGTLIASTMVDDLEIQSTRQGTTVRMGWNLVAGRHTKAD